MELKTPYWAVVQAVVTASKETVWEMLTLPEHKEKYMYECQLHTSGVVGAPASWRAKNSDGDWVDHVKAKVLAFEVGKHLAFEIFHEATESYGPAVSELHFYIERCEEGTQIRIAQGDFKVIENGLERCKSCQQGWGYVLPELVRSCNLMKK